MAASVVFALLFVGVVGSKVPRPGRTYNHFFLSKITRPADYDVVIAGDSRTYRGVDPASFGKSLPGAKVLNFGFSSAAFTDDFIAATEGRLRKDAPRKIVVLGITPYALSSQAAEQNDFQTLTALDPVDRFNLLTFGDLYSFLYRGDQSYHQVPHPDGWIESWRDKDKPEQAIALYEERFKREGSSPEIAENLLRHVRRMTDQGIHVFAVRVPTTRDMAALEDRMSGLDFKKFAADFQKNGGTWIEADQTIYPSYDGSHLRKEGAVAFSDFLGRQVAKSLSNSDQA